MSYIDSMHHVYVIQNKLNLKIYVGYSANFEKRIKDHKVLSNNANSYRYNEPFYRAIRRDGWDNFSKQIIETFDNKQEALEAESFWIQFFRSNRNKYGPECGYNMTDGGDHPGHRVYSVETIKKMSAAKLGKPGHRKGAKHSTASIEKMKIAKLGKVGKKHSEESKQKMRKPKKKISPTPET